MWKRGKFVDQLVGLVRVEIRSRPPATSWPCSPLPRRGRARGTDDDPDNAELRRLLNIVRSAKKMEPATSVTRYSPTT